MERVILVDKNDKEIGTEEKIAAHRAGKLHRAFSIFIFNSEGKLLLQKRAAGKYHSAGLWANTCCSHPRIGENLQEAVHRRLVEEVGFDCELHEIFRFIYKVKLGKLFEHELDHVFIGSHDTDPKPNPEEVADFKWMSLEELKKDILENPDNYTYWLKAAIDGVISAVKNSGTV